MRRTATLLSLAAFVAVGACSDAEPEAEMEGGTEAGEAETDVAVTTMDVDFAQWDADQSETLSAGEWDVWWVEVQPWHDWDLDDEVGLSDDEWYAVTHTLWDTDGDEVVVETEWVDATDRWYGSDVAYGTWTDWDLDGDGELDANEVAEGLERENLYDLVDRDDDLLIDDEELADWFFDVFDANDDDVVDVTEWDRGANYGFGS